MSMLALFTSEQDGTQGSFKDLCIITKYRQAIIFQWGCMLDINGSKGEKVLPQCLFSPTVMNGALL